MPPWAPTTVLPASTLGREGGQSARGPAVCTQLYHEKRHGDFLLFIQQRRLSLSNTSCVTTNTHHHEGLRSPGPATEHVLCPQSTTGPCPPPPPPRSLISRKPSGGQRKESTCFYFFLSLRRSQCCGHALNISKTKMAGGGIAHTLTLVRGAILGLTGSKTREAWQKALEHPVVHLTHWP